MLSRRAWLWVTVIVSPGLFALIAFVRMDAAYGPFNLSPHLTDWVVVWELLRYGQMSVRVVMESAAAGAVGALLPWLIYHFLPRLSRTGSQER